MTQPEWVLSLHASVRHLPDPERAGKALCSWAAVQTSRERTHYGVPAIDPARLPDCTRCQRKASRADAQSAHEPLLDTSPQG